MTVTAVEVVFRGIFQKTLSRNLCRNIVLAARKEGKIGTAFGRYSDSPERNGIPAKYFAVVADDGLELEASLATYEPTAVDVTIVVDDTLCKGIESWAWAGLQPINAITKEGGTILVTSLQGPTELLEDIHVRDESYNLAILKGAKSFSGMWVFKDDHTDVRVMGALAKVCPQLAGLQAYLDTIADQGNDELKKTSARNAHDRIQSTPVEPGQGNTEEPFSFVMPGWREMEDALVIPAVETGGGFRGGDEGYQPGRNQYFKKWSTRTMRPVINFETCTKCTLCWLQCPDTCFDVTPEGVYDANMEACCGCGVCEEVCPIAECVTMVHESEFNDNASQFEHWTSDRDGYMKWLEEKIASAKAEKGKVGRSHGLYEWDSYKKEIEITGVASDD
ncbi:MAG: (4Fe-4S)-binding protein [SAR202 cluster bacterium]|nr:(4Fe-4S)-binding protein [SAR202 cluster bacterium]